MVKWWCKTGSREEAYFLFCFSNYSDQFRWKLKNMYLVILSFHSGYHENDWFLRCIFYGKAREWLFFGSRFKLNNLVTLFSFLLCIDVATTNYELPLPFLTLCICLINIRHSHTEDILLKLYYFCIFLNKNSLKSISN